jgi:methylated-DNA-protein-cysteine methyltransferase-like protein
VKPESHHSTAYPRIYAVVAAIPRGKVATYGQVAELAGLPGRARQVGYAMHALDADTPIPWHRVVNARGEISPRTAGPEAGTLQRQLLETEGVRFGVGGRIQLDRYRWNPAT